jgi:hypothetical protein
MKLRFILATAFCLLATNTVCADFGGARRAFRAISPDGNLVVRIALENSKRAEPAEKKRAVVFYEYVAAEDRFMRRSEFQIDEKELPHLLYVSNSGDVILIILGDEGAVTTYSREGANRKSWALRDFLKESEIEGCAQTGTTLQWFEEGAFEERTFYFSGPAHHYRAVQIPFTLMRGVDDKVSFSGALDCEFGKISIERPEE